MSSRAETYAKPIFNTSIEQIESLGEALLDFTQIGDLTNWLDIHSS